MLAQILALLFIVSFASNDALLSQPLTVRWRYESPVTLNLTPAFDNERIYLPLAGGTIVALKAKDGQLYWRSEIGGELSASPVPSGTLPCGALGIVSSLAEASASS